MPRTGGEGRSEGDGPSCYTSASLQGSWAVIGTYGANVAKAFGNRQLDGYGNLTGTFILNAPTAGSTTGARTISKGTQMGTFTVNCDGTGQIDRVVTSSLGITTHQIDDFIITKAIVKGGTLIATEIADAVETPSALIPGGIFLFRAWTRLPDLSASTQQ